MWRLLLLFALINYMAPSCAMEFRVEAPDELRALIVTHIPTNLSNSSERDQALYHLRSLLATEGYFQPSLEFSEQSEAVLVKISPGPRTVINKVIIKIEGLNDPKRIAMLESYWLLPAGEPFRQSTWSLAKEQLLQSLRSEDYAASRLLDSTAAIDAELHRADLTLHYDAGPLFRFGEIKIRGLKRYSPELLNHYNTQIRPGQIYREDSVAKLQAALQSAPYFTAIHVEIDRTAEAEPDGTVTAPLLITLNEREPHLISFGVGASSNTGARSEMNFRTTDFLRRAWEFNSGLRLEQKKQVAYGDLYLPPNDLQYRDNVGVLAENTDIQNLHTEHLALGLQRQHQMGEHEFKYSLTWHVERVLPQGEATSQDRNLVSNVLWIWRHLDSLLDPRSGLILQGQIGGATKELLSDQNFLRLHTRTQFYFPISENNVLSLRGEVGYTLAESRRGIPQDYLFRAGGSGSVRGYAYQSLGPRFG